MTFISKSDPTRAKPLASESSKPADSDDKISPRILSHFIFMEYLWSVSINSFEALHQI